MKWTEGNQFENAPPGNFLGRCIQIIDLGTQQHSNPKTGEAWGQRDVRIVWELPTEAMQGIYKPELKGQPFAVSGTYKQSLHSASKLRKLLVAWRGREFSDDEVSAFDPRMLLGQPCTLSLVQNGDYVNVHSASGVMRGMSVPAQINPSIYLSLEAADFDETVFFALPEKTRERISGSPEFKELLSMRPHLAHAPAQQQPQGFRPDPRQTPPPNTYHQPLPQFNQPPQRPVSPPMAPRPPVAPAYQPPRPPAPPVYQPPRPPASAYPSPVTEPVPADDVPWPTDGRI